MQEANGQAHIVQINISKGGVPKTPVGSARVTLLGLDGDQHNFEDHGGPERAVCLYALERIQSLQAEGHPITPGAVGENLTVAGLDWNKVEPGTHIHIGPQLILEVTRFTVPCNTIQDAFLNHDYGRISQTQHPGWSRVYARVIQEGVVNSGDSVWLE